MSSPTDLTLEIVDAAGTLKRAKAKEVYFINDQTHGDSNALCSRAGFCLDGESVLFVNSSSIQSVMITGLEGSISD